MMIMLSRSNWYGLKFKVLGKLISSHEFIHPRINVQKSQGYCNGTLHKYCVLFEPVGEAGRKEPTMGWEGKGRGRLVGYLVIRGSLQNTPYL
jgi:hypothetical protein